MGHEMSHDGGDAMARPCDDLVSIIVPAYKVEDYLDECVASILAQTHKAIEIILVDDGSPDRCGEMCDSWAARDPRVRVIHQANAGLSAARNAGIAIATGTWLMFVDGDDVVSPEFCAIPLALATSHGAQIVAFSHDRILPDGSPRETGGVVAPANEVIGPDEALVALARGELFDYAWDKIYLRELFDGIEYPVGMTFEDQGVSYLLFERAERILSSDEVLYHYRLRDDSITTAGDVFEAYLVQTIHRMRAAEHLQTSHPEASWLMRVRAVSYEYMFCKHCYLDNVSHPELDGVRGRLLARHEEIRELLPRTQLMIGLMRLSPSAFGLVARAIVAIRQKRRG